ncbi:MAG: prolyl oligopeptidase family serine peptidase [Gemmatimonadales bacterium]|nr:prolyl oligopeptidase family serine peptidase [Gemmatimonadales bacterium]
MPRSLVLLAVVALPLAAQQPARVLVPNDQLVAEGLPPVPAALAEQTRRYTEARSAGFVAWHPRRAEMLISTRFGNVPQLHRVVTPLGARTQLTFFEEPIGGGSYDPVEGRFLVFAKDRGGDEFGQLYRFDLASGEATLLTDGGRSQNGGVRWSRKGDRFAYGTTRRNGADRDLHVMDPRDPRTDRRVLEASGGGWSVLDWSPDDRTLLVGQYLSVTNSRLWLVDVATGAARLLTPVPAGQEVAYDGGAFSRDGKGVWTTTDAGSEFRRLARLDVATGAASPVTTALPWDVEEFTLSDDGARLAFVTNEAGIARLHLLDTRTLAHAPVTGVPTGLIGGLAFTRDGRTLGFTLSSARTPADAYALDVATRKLVRWTESELGGLDAAQLSEPTLVRWTSFDGREITGFKYAPPARFTGRRPVIVNIHGGPEGQSRPGFQGRNNFHLNELGVAIIYPNVRGSTGYGKTFVSLDNGPKRLDSVRDIGALLDWIATQPDLDPAKVMVTGGSYGGYMTLAVATMYDERIAASLDVVGISNFNTFLKNTEAYRRDLRRVEYGDERDPAMARFFDETAPLTNAARITKPLFVVQGANDPRVPKSEADQMVATVRKNGSPVWYLVAKDEGHGFRKKANVDFQFHATIEFVRRFLLAREVSVR